MSLVVKVHRRLREEGFLATIRCAAAWLSQKAESLKLWVLRQICGPRTIFSYYYRTNKWSNPESRSGAGSTVHNTESVRVGIERLVRKYGIRTIYDAPCGDFNWMRHVRLPPGVRYIGGDIVRQMVESLEAGYGRPDRSFILTDIVADRFSSADLWICRDCFIHLSYEHISAALKNYCESGIPFALITTDTNGGGKKFENRDIRTGAFRRLDLLAPPFSFPAETREEIEDGADPEGVRKLCLWTADQVKVGLRNLEMFLGPRGERC